MPELIMMIGLPGSGKSTYIRKLCETEPEKNYHVCGTDHFIEEIAIEKGITYSEAFKLINFRNLNKKFHDEIKESVKNDHNIIIDRTNMTEKSRKPLLEMIPSHYYKKAIVFSLTDIELTKRLKEREIKEGKYIPAKVIAGMYNTYNPPTKLEFNEILYIRD